MKKSEKFESFLPYVSEDIQQQQKRGDEWMRGLGLGFTNHVGTGEVLDVCLWGMGSGLGTMVLEQWGGVMSA